jgi:hypothetical protein
LTFSEFIFSNPHLFFGDLLRSNVCLTELTYQDYRRLARPDFTPVSDIATALANDASYVLERLTIGLKLSELQALVPLLGASQR